jgi:uncharacterized protein YjbI with pentapeptide repeats
MLFGLENQGILQAVFRYPFRTLDRPTTDCSCNWCNMAMLQHIVSMALVPCDHFLHVSRPYPFLTGAEWQRQHDETSRTIFNVLLALVTFSFFCLLSLGAPDTSLLATDATIKLPFANTDISFGAFLFLGPVVLISLTIYLYIFVEYRRTLGVLSKDPGLPHVFNLQHCFPRLVSSMLLYWLVPCTLLMFSYKASPRPDGRVLMIITIVVTIVLVGLQIRHWPLYQRHGLYRSLWAIEAFLVVVLLLQLVKSSSLVTRPLILFHAKLEALDLTAVNLQNANLQEANLQKANLLAANLQGAMLLAANLQGAMLMEANLRDAEFLGANMQDAMLPLANLQRATLELANLQQATLALANLQQADLVLANLQGAELQGANFRQATLVLANLQGAKLQGANFQQANLIQANLRGITFAEDNSQGFDHEQANRASAEFTRKGPNFVKALRQRGKHPLLNSMAIVLDVNLQREVERLATASRGNLQGAKLQRADLFGANLIDTVGLTQDQVNTACVDEETRLPKGLTKPAPCSANP